MLTAAVQIGAQSIGLKCARVMGLIERKRRPDDGQGELFEVSHA